MYMSIYTYIYRYTHTHVYIYIYMCVCACVYSGSRKVGMCPQKQIDPKPQVPTLILEAKVGTWSKNSPEGKLEPVLPRERDCNY